MVMEECSCCGQDPLRVKVDGLGVLLLPVGHDGRPEETP